MKGKWEVLAPKKMPIGEDHKANMGQAIGEPNNHTNHDGIGRGLPPIAIQQC